MLNLNNVTPAEYDNTPLELMPDGTIVRGIVKLVGGDTELPEFGAGQYFKSSLSSAAKWLPIEVTIVGGQFDKRKVWHNIFVDGNKMSERGVPIAKEIGLRMLKSMIDSAKNLSSKDDTPEAQAARNLNGVNDLNGVSICFAIGIEKSNDPQYADKNKIKYVLTAESKGFIAGDPSAIAVQAPVATPANPTAGTPQTTATAGVTPPWAR
tara:strand:+ start:1458 stop:2084 length:627 start_codon:yes stop_codon:yes gene_type:complete